MNVAIVDRRAFEPVRTGLEIAAALRQLHPNDWETDKLPVLLLNRQVLDAILAGDADRAVSNAAAGSDAFARRRGPHLLYE